MSKEVRKDRVLDKDMMDLLNGPHCTAARIQALLEDAQKRGAKVNKTAQDKETLITENLRNAVSHGHVPLQEVFDLLSDSEENDSQYHFFYTVIDAQVKDRLSNFVVTGDSLFGKNWQARMGFPKFLVKPMGEIWSDFRSEGGSPGEPGWVLKMYRGQSRWILDEKASTSTATRRVKVWVPKYMREVWLVRWHPQHSLLELCLPRLGNRKEQFESRDELWGKIGSVIARDTVEEFGFGSAATAMVHDETGLNGQVHFGGPARLMSGDGGMTMMMPRSSQQGIHDAADRREALKHYKDCRELCVFWKKTTATDAISDDTKTIIGFWGAENSILFTARNSGKTVRYVAKKFIELELGRRATNGASPKDSKLDSGPPAGILP